MANLTGVQADFEVSVALGQVTGWSYLRKFAMLPAAVSGTSQVWPLATIQTLPTTAAIPVIASNNANDTSAGTGARTIIIEGLDSNYVEQSETITMNGTTNVNAANSYLRVYRAYVVLVGSSSQNEGNITISIGGNTQAYIEANEGQTHISQYTVPADKVLFLRRLYATVGRVGNADVQLQWQMRLLNNGWRTMLDLFPYEGQVSVEGVFPVPAKTDIRALLVSSAANFNCHTEYSGFLIDEDAY